MYDAAFYEVFEEEESHLREYLPQDYEYYFTKKSIQDTDTDSISAPIISTRTQSKFPPEWKDTIQAIFTRSTGYDHVTAYFRQIQKSIPAGHLPKYAARAVAEQALMLMLMLLRKIDSQRESMQSFSRDGLTGSELRNKVLTVIGVGNIGSELIRIGHGLKMDLQGVDIKPDRELAEQYSLKYVSLNDGVANADIVVCALPLTDTTHKMLNYPLLSRCGNNPILVNIARGEITPPGDLLQLLDDGILSGLGLDVYDEESTLGSYLRGEIAMRDISDTPLRQSIESTITLMKHPGVICTPHNAFNTRESTDRKSRQTAENLHHYFNTGEFLTPIPID